MDLTIVSVVRPIPSTDPFSLFPLQDWTQVARRSAEDLVKGLAAAVMDDHYTVGTEVMMGDPVDMLTERSISHALLHGVPCPVLVVR